MVLAPVVEGLALGIWKLDPVAVGFTESTGMPVAAADRGTVSILVVQEFDVNIVTVLGRERLFDAQDAREGAHRQFNGLAAVTILVCSPPAAEGNNIADFDVFGFRHRTLPLLGSVY